MIQGLFTWLSHALQGTVWLALIASFGWGILSILLSPCHLSSIPLIVAYIDGQGQISGKRALSLSGLFSVGILITIAGVGLLTSLTGRILGDIGKAGNWIVAMIFFIIGLHLLGVIPFPLVGRMGQPSFKHKGPWVAFLIGLLFGLAVGPCTFAYLGPILAVAFRVAPTQLLLSVSLVLTYAIGHCSVIVLAGTLTGLVQRFLNWNEQSKGALILKKICGLLVILGGIYLILNIR